MASPEMGASIAFKILWPLIPAFAVGMIGYGMLRGDVRHVKAQQDLEIVARQSDHDSIVRMEVQQKVMQNDLVEIKDSVKEIAKAIK
jgi:hypothetical protein